MNCLEAERELRGDIDGETSGTPINGHLADCPSCREKSRRLRGLIAEIQAQPRPQTSTLFIDRLHKRLEPVPIVHASWFKPRLTWKVALSFGLAAACGPQAFEAVSKAFQLNRWGKWSEAAKVAAKAADTSGASLEDHCAAIVNAAYANARLNRDEKAWAFAKRFAKECRDVPPESWMRREMGKLQVEYTLGSPAWFLKRAMQLNQSGDWPLAGLAADAVLSTRKISVQERCEAYFDKSSALTRMRDHSGALLVLKTYDAQCQSVPRGYWTHRETAKLKAELTQTLILG